MKRCIKAVAGIVVGLAVISVAFSIALRDQRSVAMLRRFNKRYLNPVMLRWAGERGFYAATIEHVGRSSGTHHQTPILAEPMIDGFVIPLPYGTDVDWLKNALAAGTATIHRHGVAQRVGDLEVVGYDDVALHLTPKLRRRFSFYGIDRYVIARLRGNGGHLTVAT